MNFKQAIEEMKKGKKVRRKGWKDRWFVINDSGNLLCCTPNFYNKAQTDTKIDDLSLTNVEHILAEDWEIVEDKKQKQWWEPKLDEKYYLVCCGGWIDYNNYDDDDADKCIMAIGNCFQTAEQAKFMVEKLKVIHELEKFAYENNEEELDWNDELQNKYYLAATYKKNGTGCVVFYTSSLKDIPFNIYFSSEKIAKEAIETIGEDRIKKYYFGVE